MPNSLIGLWRQDPTHKEGKFPVIFRRDGTIPHWPWFVLGARDPAAPHALREYAKKCRELKMDEKYCYDLEQEATRFEEYRTSYGNGDPDAGPHRKDNQTILMLARGELDFRNLERAHNAITTIVRFIADFSSPA